MTESMIPHPGRLYLGMEKRNGEVITEKGNKWSNLEYFKLTGLREYAPYMMGGGCGPQHCLDASPDQRRPSLNTVGIHSVSFT